MRQGNSFGSRAVIPFAHQNDGFNARVESVESESVDGEKTYTIHLKEESRGSNLITDIQYNNNGKTYTPQKIATLRASRILLDDPPAPKQSETFNRTSSQNWDTVMDESMIAGHGAVKVNVCAIKSVFHTSNGNLEEKLAQSRLLAVYFLKVTGVIEHVLELGLGINSNETVTVNFRGVRTQQYSNVDPEEVRVSGQVKVS